MPTVMTNPAANDPSIFALSAKKARQQRRACVLTLAILIAFAAFSPSAQGQTITTLFSFPGGANGSTPFGGVVRDSADNLYGTTERGGSFDFGTVYKLDSIGNETVLHSFASGSDGASPVAGVLRDTAGNLYGATQNGGGTSNSGTVFKIDSTGEETVLHSFGGGARGSLPSRGVIRDSAGNIYSTTELGGDRNCGDQSGCGVVFKLSATGKETVLHTFTSTDTAANPVSSLVRDAAGNLFGTTFHGGVGVGTVFELDPTGKETILYIFSGGADGAFPLDGLLVDGEDLAGITSSGGTKQRGVVFKIDKSGHQTVVHTFTGGSDGSTPSGILFRDSTGNVYGATLYGGTFNNGTVFELDPAGRETILHNFAGGSDGANPFGGVIRDSDGNLYGTTEHGGVFGVGTVFKITP
jgi:uncharacterized repeat protein (TIGR03803 family)